MPIPLLRRRVKQSLKAATLDGAAFSAMAGLTQNYITAFALALKATTFHVGLLASIPNLMMSLSQLASPLLTDKAGSRKGLILPVVFVHALLWIPMLLIPWVLPEPKIWWLIILVTLSGVFGAIGNPAWGSMMADLVPMQIRGRYFSMRARTVGLVGLVFTFIAGGILEILKGDVFIGFAILFAAAALFRLLSFYFLSTMYEPAPSAVPVPGAKLTDMIKHLGSSSLGRFILFVALMSFSQNLASPFFSVYMLRDLEFSYMTFMFCTAANAVSNLLFQTFWGRRTDRFGNVNIIRVASYMMPVIPCVWLLNDNPFFIMGAQMYSGIVWSGFTLATTNYVYDAADPENRSKSIALFNATNGVFACLGALLGGYLARYVPVLFNSNLQTMFLLSGIARGLVVLFLLRYVKEVRKVPRIKALQVLFGKNSRPPLIGSSTKS
jgi:MFS family permease